MEQRNSPEDVLTMVMAAMAAKCLQTSDELASQGQDSLDSYPCVLGLRPLDQVASKAFGRQLVQGASRRPAHLAACRSSGRWGDHLDSLFAHMLEAQRALHPQVCTVYNP